MFGANTILTVHLAPKDTYAYNLLRKFHTVTKRRWKSADILGADEVKVLGCNKRNQSNHRSFKINGWENDRKSESLYQDVVGDPYYSYYKDFTSGKIEWWGEGSSNELKKKVKERNEVSVPNSPMFDVSIEFDKNSVMEKIYMKNKDYDTARSTTYRGKQGLSIMSLQLKESNMKDGMTEEEAIIEANRKVDIYTRNLALGKNPQSKNEYRFMVNYYNKHVHENRREMFKFNVNIWFLKEIMRHNLNISMFVSTPTNDLVKIQGLVGKRCKNTIMVMNSPAYTYSFDFEHKIKLKEKGFKPLNKIRLADIKLDNPMYGGKVGTIRKRLTSEYLYDLILLDTNKHSEWVDKFHNVFQSVDYSNPTNLNGKDIIC